MEASANNGSRVALAVLSALLVASPFLASVSGAHAVAPDPTFSGGIVTTAIGPTTDEDSAFALAIQPDGKLVLAGTSEENFALARYNADGTLDDSFGGDGKVVTPMGGGAEASGPADEIHAIAIQPDGRIVAAGFANAISTSGGLGGDFALARYNEDGTLDDDSDGSGFDVDGTVISEPGTFSGPAFGVALQGDGKIVAAGRAGVAGSGDDFALARYNSDGTPDSGFDDDGMLTTDVGGTSNADRANDVVIQADGKIVVAGFSNTGESGVSDDFALARYNPDGTLDDDSDGSGFGGDGTVTTPISTEPTFNQDQANAVTVQPDGKVVAAGSSQVPSDEFALVRYTSGGDLDGAFSGDGKVTTQVSPIDGTSVANAVSLQADGKIVAAGRANNSQGFGLHQDFGLARYNPNGSLDPIFGGDGRVNTGVAADPFVDVAHAVGIQPDGKIVAGGLADTASAFDFALVRYIEVPETSITFGPSGVTSDPTPSFGFSSDEPGSTFECRVDAAAFAPCSGPGDLHTPAALADGQHTFRVRAIDPDGDADPTPAVRVFAVDTSPPPAPGGGGGGFVSPALEASNHFKLGKLVKNKRKGVAFLIAFFPGPGEVGMAGAGVRGIGLRTDRLARKSLAVAGGRVALKIAPAKKGKRARRVRRQLSLKGKAWVKVRVTYVPTGGAGNTRARKVKLIRK